ncbi:MAG: hypothetical protein H7281_14450 [Bacteriovorax sp.]|nr:hypothetical protein [Bacteriovorax sp.]
MKLALLLLFAFTSTSNLHAQELDQVNALIKKYKVTPERPKACPLESKKFADLLTKTETIKNIFKSNCLQKDPGKMTEVLNSVKDIQDELKNRNIIDKTVDGSSLLNAITGNDSTSAATTPATGTTAASTTSTSTSTTALNGAKFSTLFSNITTMIKKNQCNLDDGRVLEMTADLINDSTQLGLLSGNELGIIVAGGGFIVSSALRLIDMIIKQKFDFVKNIDRQTFIKLNCSFYDIRHDLESRGALDVEDNSSREDLKDTKDLIEKINISIKALAQEKTDEKKTLESMDQEALVELVGDVTIFKKNLNRVKTYLSVGIVDSAVLPSETQKLIMITKVAQDYDLLVTQLNNYRSLKISSIPMLDDIFLQDLAKFNSIDVLNFGQLLTIKASEFNDNQRAKILFHVTRILSDIGIKEEIASTKNIEAKKLKVSDLQKKLELYTPRLAELKKIEERLNRVVSPKEYSATDDGTDNMVSMLENYKNISEQIYGEWGEKFLKYTTQKSYAEAKTFREKIERFNTKYGDQPKNFKVDKSPATYICQDIQKIRISYKYAESVVQEGYDFIVTNKDLFHTDSRNYYNNTLDEETNGGSSPIEKIQRHYKSTILALRKLKKEQIDPADEEKYLTRTFNGTSFLGKSMIDVSAAKVLAREIQDRFERINCNKALGDDLN